MLCIAMRLNNNNFFLGNITWHKQVRVKKSSCLAYAQQAGAVTSRLCSHLDVYSGITKVLGARGQKR